MGDPGWGQGLCQAPTEITAKGTLRGMNALWHPPHFWLKDNGIQK